MSVSSDTRVNASRSRDRARAGVEIARRRMPHRQQVRREDYYPQRINQHSDPGLVTEKSSAMRQHQCDENGFARTSDSEDQGAHRHFARSVDEHGADQRNERAPVADDDVGDRPAHAFSKRRPKRSFRCERGVDHRHRQDARNEHDPMDVRDDPRHGGLRSRSRVAKNRRPAG